jgi:hypothetical protein
VIASAAFGIVPATRDLFDRPLLHRTFKLKMEADGTPGVRYQFIHPGIATFFTASKS